MRELVYAEGVLFQGCVCRDATLSFASDTMNCDFCGMPAKPDDDLMEAIIAKALAEGATIEQVRGEAAEKLRAVGGIGAFLRY